MFSGKSRSPAENKVVARKIKTSAEFSDLSLKFQKFSRRFGTSRIGLIKADKADFPLLGACPEYMDRLQRGEIALTTEKWDLN